MSLLLLALGSKSVVIRPFTANVSALEEPKITLSLAVRSVNVPATGVVPPITVLLIVPPDIAYPVTFPLASLNTALSAG